MYTIEYQSGRQHIVCLMGRPIKDGIQTIEQAESYIETRQFEDFLLYEGLESEIAPRVLKMGHC
jgi:hypothetical protein